VLVLEGQQVIDGMDHSWYSNPFLLPKNKKESKK